MTEYTPDSCDEDCITVKDAQFLTNIVKIIYDTVLNGQLSIEKARKRIIKNIKNIEKAEFRQGDYDSRLISLFPKDKKVVTLNLLYHLCKEDKCCNNKDDYRGKRKNSNYCVGVAICLLPSIDCHEKCEVLGICQDIVKKGQPVLQNKADKGLYLFDCRKPKKCKSDHDDKVYDEVVVVCCSGEEHTFPANKSIDYGKICKDCEPELKSRRRSKSCSPSRSRSRSHSKSRSRSHSKSRSRSHSKSKSRSHSKRRSASCSPKRCNRSYSDRSDSSCPHSSRSGYSTPYYSDRSDRSYSDYSSSCEHKKDKPRYKKCGQDHYVIDSIVDYPTTPSYQKDCNKGYGKKHDQGYGKKHNQGYGKKHDQGYGAQCSIRHKGYRYGDTDQQQPNESHEEYCLRYYRQKNNY